MRLYIDPGTGSMLFAILIGLIGAFRYLLKSWLVKLRFRMSGGKSTEAEQEKLPLVIFSDDKRYWQVFGPVCRELSARGVEVTYMTESEDDPARGLTFISGSAARTLTATYTCCTRRAKFRATACSAPTTTTR